MTGTMRLDWFTPDGLADWGDGRLFLVGTDGTLELRKNLDIEGPGPDQLTISANHASRVFEVASGVTDATLAGLKIADGQVRHDEGGAILNSGTLTLSSMMSRWTGLSTTLFAW